MAHLTDLHLCCPSCGETVTVPVAAVLGEADSGLVPVAVAPDLAPISAHAATHREA